MNLINKEGIDIIVKNNKKTPRIALCCYFGMKKPEKHAGIHSLLTKLMFQGTKTRSGKELALELEENGIEMSIKCKQDFFRVNVVCLKEDLERATEILKDVILNSTFDDFEKEVFKLKGEIVSDLDNPKVKAVDGFVREIFKGHCYSNSHTKILEEIDKIKKEDIINVLEEIMQSEKFVVTAGDFESEDEIAQYLAGHLSFMKNIENEDEVEEIEGLKEDKVIKIVRDDANQAHIIQGWLAPSFESEDYPKIIVMNNIFGSSGLSSRLFCELRDKQGLAYHVRSTYEVLKHGAVLNCYIATTPKNIEKSLSGFKIEIEKLQNEFVSDEELQGAKENGLGKNDYFFQTNLQQASSIGFDGIMGLGLDFREKYRDMINRVTKEDVQNVAKKYLSLNSVTAILAPSEYLN
jgi:zinc protease